MNYQELMTLSGFQLDIAVHKALFPNHEKVGEYGCYYNPDKDRHAPIPYYSTDIAAAFIGWKLGWMMDSDQSSRAGAYTIYDGHTSYLAGKPLAQAETMPLAICRAVLHRP